MKRFRFLPATAFLVLLPGAISWAQRSGSSAPSAPSSGNGPNSNAHRVSRPPSPQSPPPFFVSGRVLMETGQPVPEPVSVQLDCGMRVLQVIRTDLKGYFQFTLGSGPQGNIDYSAANDQIM